MRTRSSARWAMRSKPGPRATTCAMCGFCSLTKGTKPLTAKGGKIARRTQKKSKGLRRFALHLHSCPLFQQGKCRGVVEVTVAVFGGHFVDFFHGFEGGQLYAGFFRSFKC